MGKTEEVLIGLWRHHVSVRERSRNDNDEGGDEAALKAETTGLNADMIVKGACARGYIRSKDINRIVPTRECPCRSGKIVTRRAAVADTATRQTK